MNAELIRLAIQRPVLIPPRVLWDPGIETERATLIQIYAFVDEAGFAPIDAKGLEIASGGRDHNTYRRHIRQLEELNYIERIDDGIRVALDVTGKRPWVDDDTPVGVQEFARQV